MNLSSKLIAGIAVMGLLGLSTMPADAQAKKAPGSCIDKGGRGWGSNTEDARFQAWEAVLQANDWGMWSVWISTGAKVGQAAAGYSVSNVRERCSKDGAQQVCIMRAKLCK